MDEQKLLEGIMKKQKRGEGKTDNKNAVAALMSLRSSIDEKQIAQYLAGFHFSVCQNFLMEYCVDASDEEIRGLINALLDDESMKTKNPTLFLFPKGFSAVYSLIAKKKYAPALMIINRILIKAEGKKGFMPSTLTIFNKIFTEPKDVSGITQLYYQLESGKIKSEACEKDRLARFLEFAQILHHEKVKTDEILSELPQRGASIRFVEQIKEIELNMLSNIEKTQEDIVAMVKKLSEGCEKKAAQESENAELRSKVNDLTERLRVSLQMKGVSENQELMTLKNEIFKAIKLDYADFEKSKDKGNSKDLFKVYKAMLTRIFKQLKRLDIPLA